jgi:hypothetical protein
MEGRGQDGGGENESGGDNEGGGSNNEGSGGGERKSTLIFVRRYPGSTRLAGKPGPPWCL